MKKFKKKSYQLGGWEDENIIRQKPFIPYQDTESRGNDPMVSGIQSNPLSVQFGRPALPSSIAPPSPAASPAQGGNKFDWGQVSNKVNDVMPYATNLVNLFRQVPKPIAPKFESPISAKLVNYDTERSLLDREVRGVNKGMRALGSNPGLANAQAVSTLGKYLDSRARIGQAERNTNAQIENQNNQFNAGIAARNNERTNDYQDSLVARTMAQQRMQSENLADFSNKAQLSRRDRDVMELENRKLDTIGRVYKDSGVVDRNLLDLIQEGKYPQRKRKLGGKIK